MSPSYASLLTCILPLLAAATVAAQTVTLPGEHTTFTAVVEAIERASRVVIVKDPAGDQHTIRVPPEVTRFPEVKVGDTYAVTYYDTITIRLKQPSEPEVDTLAAGITPGGGRKPVGTTAAQQTITATIDAIDLEAPSISFKGPRGWSYSTKVQDKKKLRSVKVGDRVDITWTEALLVSVAAPKR
jgi:hypothetical protein